LINFAESLIRSNAHKLAVASRKVEYVNDAPQMVNSMTETKKTLFKDKVIVVTNKKAFEGLYDTILAMALKSEHVMDLVRQS
jgi:hypothetical protein